MGRPQNFLFKNDFILLKDEIGRNYAKCKRCQRTFRNTASRRLQRHNELCVQQIRNEAQHSFKFPNTAALGMALQTAQNDGINIKDESIADENMEIDDDMEVCDGLEAPLQTLTMKKNQIEVALDRADLMFVKFLISNGLPFNLAKSSHFTNFIGKLQPNYTIPIQKYLIDTLLNDVYRSCNNKKNNNSESVLLIDEWVDLEKNIKVIVTILYDDPFWYVLNVWEYNDPFETFGELLKIVEQSIQMANNRFGSKIYAVVSEYSAHISKIARILGIWHFYSHIHAIKMLAIDWLNEISLNSTFINTLRNLDELQYRTIDSSEERSDKIVSNKPLKWMDDVDLLQEFLNYISTNRNHLRSLADKIFYSRLQILSPHMTLSDNFFADIRNKTGFISCICSLQSKLKNTNCTVAKSIEQWLNLQSNFDWETLPTNNYDQMIINIPALAAVCVDPFNDTKKMTPEQIDQVNEFFAQNLDKDDYDLWVQFRDNEEFFATLREKISSDPIVFWRTAELKYPKFASKALQLLKIPASCAYIHEQTNWPMVYSNIRNSLSKEDTKKYLHSYLYFQFDELNKVNPV